MTEHPFPLRRVAWQEVFPWFLIFRCWGLAISGPIWLMATVGVLLGPIGFWLGSFLFLSAEAREAREQRDAVVQMVEKLANPHALPQSFADLLHPATSAGGVVVQRFTQGWQHLISPPGSWNETAFVIFGGLWTLLIWSFVAGMITRASVMRLGCDRQTTIPGNFRFVQTRWRSYLAAPLLPLAPLLLGSIALGIIGWIGNSGVGLLLVGLLWPIILVVGAILTLLLVGVALGWPFMWVALGAETDADAFEAVSRGYTYALQRPLRLIGYVTVAALIGLVGWIVVYHLSEILIAFISSGLPERVFGAAEGEEPIGLLFGWGASLIHLGNGLVRSVAQAYGYSFFFCAAAAAYLLLRKDIDEAPIDQVHDDRDDDEALQLPPIPNDLLSATSANESDSSKSAATENPLRTESDHAPRNEDSKQVGAAEAEQEPRELERQPDHDANGDGPETSEKERNS